MTSLKFARFLEFKSEPPHVGSYIFNGLQGRNLLNNYVPGMPVCAGTAAVGARTAQRAIPTQASTN